MRRRSLGRSASRRATPRLGVALGLAFVIAHLAAPDAGRATTFRVGPSWPYATPSDVPWESLAAGDSVLIHARPAPYLDKWVICRVGTEAAPIVVRGVPDESGALPVIDGANAVTRPTLNFWNEERGVIKIGGANSPPDAMPAWIVIESLDIRGARPQNSFTGRNGLTSYAGNASAIYIEKGQHIVVRGCRLHDCSNGFFCANQTSDLLVEGNTIEDNGNVGSIFEHNNYTEALGIVFQFNHFGLLRAGAGGNNLKDRSAGTVIRYNWIEGGNRQLDLVESDSNTLINDPTYRETFVYGNVLVERDADGNSQIAHYGGDGGVQSKYRHGTLYFHHNTVVSRRSGNTTVLRLSSSGDSADVRNNILYVSATGNRLALLDQSGRLAATQNWLKTGWVATHSGASVNLLDNGQVTGSAPGFADESADNFELIAGSPCIGQAAALLPATIPDHEPVLEYVRHLASRPRPDDGDPDIGAYERNAAVGVPFAGEGPPRAGILITPNPFAGQCELRLAGPSAALSRAALDVLDATGRRVARLEPSAPGRWVWAPDARIAPGLYIIRSGPSSEKVLYVR